MKLGLSREEGKRERTRLGVGGEGERKLAGVLVLVLVDRKSGRGGLVYPNVSEENGKRACLALAEEKSPAAPLDFSFNMTYSRRA